MCNVMRSLKATSMCSVLLLHAPNSMPHYYYHCCDVMVPAGSYTYFHVSLNQKSFLDHVFISDTLKDRICNFQIIDDGCNTSDHLPVSFHLSVSPASTVPDQSLPDKSSIIREYRWDKGDLNAYYYYSGDLLSRIFHSFGCCANLTSCNNSNHELDIEIYYGEIIHALTTAADGTIPKVAKSAFRARCTNVVHDLGSAEPRSKVEPSSR